MTASWYAGGVFHMSVVIGICGDNFCSLVADTQKVRFTPDGTPFADGAMSKIMQVNNKTLLGSTGIFSIAEDPFSIALTNDHTVSAKMIRNRLIDIGKKAPALIKSQRNYIIGGKDKDGHFYQYQLHWDNDKQKFEGMVWRPRSGQYGVSVALPSSLNDRRDSVIELVHECITDNKTHGQLIESVKSIVCELAQHDVSINAKPEVVSIF